MKDAPNTITHSWLSDLLHKQRDHVTKLLRALSGMGPVEGMRPSIFKRFILSLQQISEAKDDETKLINQINAIEDEHRKLRARKMLREAPMEPVPLKPAAEMEPLPEPKREGKAFWWFIALWMLLHKPKVDHK